MERMERIGLNDIASLLTAKNEQLSKEDAAGFLKELITVIADSLAEDKQVEVTGFGTFIFSRIRESETNELIEAGNEEVPYYYRIGFTPHETLRNSINIFFSNFEPSLLNEGVTFDALPEVITTEAGEEEYIFNNIQKMVSLPRQQIPEPETPTAENNKAGISETLINETFVTESEIPSAEIPSAEVPSAEVLSAEIPSAEIPSAPSAEITQPEIHTTEKSATDEMIPEETIQPERAFDQEETIKRESVTDSEESIDQKEVIEQDSPLSNVLSESLQHLPPEPRLSHRTTHHERVRKRRKPTTIWVPILGGMAIILAGLFFFRETHGKSGNDNL